MKFAARVAPRAVVTTGRGTTGEVACVWVPDNVQRYTHSRASLTGARSSLLPHRIGTKYTNQVVFSHAAEWCCRACMYSTTCLPCASMCRCWPDCVRREGGWGLEP
jgi:hypothetical protein